MIVIGDRIQFQSRFGDRRDVIDGGHHFVVINGKRGCAVSVKKMRIRKEVVLLVWVQFDGEDIYPRPFQEFDLKIVRQFGTVQRGAYVEGVCSTQGW